METIRFFTEKKGRYSQIIFRTITGEIVDVEEENGDNYSINPLNYHPYGMPKILEIFQGNNDSVLYKTKVCCLEKVEKELNKKAEEMGIETVLIEIEEEGFLKGSIWGVRLKYQFLIKKEN